MPAKNKVSRMLHLRINEMLDRILEKQDEEIQDQPQLNLGKSDEPLMVSMESFFEFTFDLSGEMDEWVEKKLEDSQLDSYQRHWDPGFHMSDRQTMAGTDDDRFKPGLLKRPK